MEGLAAVLESALGPDIAASCINTIGLAVGARADHDFKRALQIDRKLNLQEFRTLLEELLANLYHHYEIVEATPTRFVVEERGSAFGPKLFLGRELSEISASIFGSLAAINFEYGKVSNVPIGGGPDGPEFQTTIFLLDDAEARASIGEEFYPEIVNAFASVETQLRVVEENRIIREQLQESATVYRDRHRQFSALAAVATVISQSLDPQEILDAGLRMLLSAVGSDFGAVFATNDETGQLQLFHHQGLSEQEANAVFWDHILPPSAPPGGQRWDILRDARRHSPPDWSYGEFQSYATAPLRSKEHSLGVVLVLGRLRRSFAPLEMELLEMVANELGVGMENIRLYDYLARQVKRLTELREISAILSRCHSIDEVLDHTAESVTDRLGFDRIGIFLVNQAEQCLEQVRGTDEQGHLFRTSEVRVPLSPVGSTLVRAVIERKPLLVLDLAGEPDLGLSQDEAEGLAHLQISAFARVPLIGESRVLGAISVDNAVHRQAVTHEDLNMLMILGNQVATAIENARATEALRDSALELQQVDAVRSQFVSMISHELRSPLHKIRNAASLLMDDETDAQRLRFEKSIIRSTDYLARVVNNLLSQARIEQKALIVHPEPLLLLPLVQDWLKELRAAVLPPEQTIELQIPDDLSVYADAPYLQMILANLISNASKASAPDGRIQVSAAPDERSTRLSVRDFGTGIEPEKRTEIFERFVTGRTGETDRISKGSGVGLGLYICRSLVEAHGGRIWLNDQIQPGTEICFSLPAAGNGRSGSVARTAAQQ